MTKSHHPAGGLTAAQLSSFNRDGYLIVPDALSPETVKSLLDETHSLLTGFDLASHPMTKFSTGGEDGENHVGDDYFLTSGDKVRFFFEEGELSLCLFVNILSFLLMSILSTRTNIWHCSQSLLTSLLSLENTTHNTHKHH